MPNMSRLGLLRRNNNVCFFLCDVQERFRDLISFMPSVIHVSNLMIETAKILELPVFVTEQYPKGLLHTCSELDISNCKVFEKTKFSMMIPPIKTYLEGEKKDVVLFGIEAHICVLQTALELVDDGHKVYVIADGTSSQSASDRFYAFDRMRQAGVYVTTYESVIFSLLEDASSEQFKAMQSVIRAPKVENGLVYQLVPPVR